MSNNLYEILGLSPEATQAEIEEAYQRKDHLAQTPAQHKALDEAYETLSDSKKREQYNLTLEPVFFFVVNLSPKPLPRLTLQDFKPELIQQKTLEIQLKLNKVKDVIEEEPELKMRGKEGHIDGQPVFGVQVENNGDPRQLDQIRQAFEAKNIPIQKINPQALQNQQAHQNAFLQAMIKQQKENRKQPEILGKQQDREQKGSNWPPKPKPERKFKPPGSE